MCPYVSQVRLFLTYLLWTISIKHMRTLRVKEAEEFMPEQVYYTLIVHYTNFHLSYMVKKTKRKKHIC